jgi:hypothetical protein
MNFPSCEHKDGERPWQCTEFEVESRYQLVAQLSVPLDSPALCAS